MKFSNNRGTSDGQNRAHKVSHYAEGEKQPYNRPQSCSWGFGVREKLWSHMSNISSVGRLSWSTGCINCLASIPSAEPQNHLCVTAEKLLVIWKQARLSRVRR